MNILWHIKNYVPKYNAGDTWMAHEINKYFVSQGHQVRVMLGMLGPDGEIDGVTTHRKHYEHYEWADVVFTHLDFTKQVFDRIAAEKPVFWIAHNTFDWPSVRRFPQVNVVYNSQAAVGLCNYPQNDHFILPPPVDTEYYNVNRTGAEYITLINPHKGKGSELFYELATWFPDKKFLAVKGSYGVQDIRELPNVTIWENQPDIREVYKRTRILLMPSIYESWGRTATEAISSGIPVICTPTFGLKENLAGAGIYCENLSSFISEMKRLDEKREYDKQSELVRKRAIELHPGSKLQEFERWVKKKHAEHTKKGERNV